MDKQNRKIRELRARFVTKLTKQTKVLSARDYALDQNGIFNHEMYKADKIWVSRYNYWHQLVARNPKQSADQIRQMSVSQKNKFFLWLTDGYDLFNPYGNHFEEKFCMVVFVLSKPKTMENLRENNKMLRDSYAIMHRCSQPVLNEMILLNSDSGQRIKISFLKHKKTTYFMGHQ